MREVLFMDNVSNAHILAPGNVNKPGVDVTRLPQVVSALNNSYDFTIFECGNSGVPGIAKIADRDTVIIIAVRTDNFAANQDTLLNCIVNIP